ncbi:PREDICTED: iron-sulfur cluster assembly protein 1-like [Tarenaya hassleriana]|uniref:iron-sulfur cluster assembly protein 1-like n=1 Tax=Tarenaya hassleriana TaxID=28532 RepID=UPI00053C4AAB|nr:PREDICTED: iron-sulfur cluster assembly protein 1-like [Tarenaya hassleriana]
MYRCSSPRRKTLRPKRETMMLRQVAKKALLGLTSRQPPPRPIGIAPRFYHERVIDHFENPRNPGTLDKSDPSVGSGLVGAPSCGDVLWLQIKVDEESDQIVDVRSLTFGCGSAMAASSLTTEWVKGKTVEEALTIKNTEIAKYLSLPPVKLHCSMLAEDAIKVAVKDYKKKRAQWKGGATGKALAEAP